VSRETPAAHLARLKVTHQGWRIEQPATGSGYTAHRCEERTAPNFCSAPTLGELEALLVEQGNR
jgi:hypothetical protein